MTKEIFAKLAKRKPDLMNKRSYLVSAVLLPLVQKRGETHILFEVRAENLKVQPGEICFPGGRVEERESQSPQETAVRETAEELGITRREIRVAGPLDILPTPQGRLVYPFAGEILTEKFRPNPREVAEIFFVPLEYFLNHPPGVSSTEVAIRYGENFPFTRIPPSYTREWQVRWSFPSYYFEYGKYFIWGLTAAILYHFLSLCWPERFGTAP
jgi:8-oxo-dGTP pyrophosphatase MutT (NUDIX family)